jgi:hypothetical protein
VKGLRGEYELTEKTAPKPKRNRKQPQTDKKRVATESHATWQLECIRLLDLSDDAENHAAQLAFPTDFLPAIRRDGPKTRANWYTGGRLYGVDE